MKFKDIKLSEITELITKGTTPTTLGYAFQSTGINFVKIESIDESGTFKSNKLEHISEECNEKLKRSKLKENDILFSIAGAIGKVAVVTKEILPANTNQALAIIRLKGDVVSIPYLLYFLKSDFVIKQFEKRKQGVAQLNLSLKDIGDLVIKVPEKNIQNKIVRILNQAKLLVIKRQSQIIALDELTQSLFLEMFGDNIKSNFEKQKIEYLSDGKKHAIKAGPFGSALKKEFYVKEGYKIYGQEQVIRDELSYGDYYIDEKKYQELINCSIKPGDILISLVGTFGKLSVVPNDFEPGIINPRLMKISLESNKVNPYFFKYLMSLPTTLQQISNNAHGGTMGIINVGIIKEFKIIVPPIDKQLIFVNKMEEIKKIKSYNQKSLAEMECLLNSLLQQAFKGELFYEQ
ncbi:restriction endonuclease subunit S [Psychrobacillus vulpis]|uniref:Type I restriction modification DNA specificity domain-containing protein n=1 Tax=Psychrobacillus vulpis TaxID=2325572 RepID=A0A544TR60_9BACI|nr:restriction endonuclease subunit S [Psychrobacillus vulpis]TQR19936.1 hypothetical protein FG384_09745 [Psychrobacillus vulpis]